MKSKNITHLTVFTLLLSLFSCSGFLTKDHPTAITDNEFWTTTNQANAALESCVSMPHGSYHYTSPNIALLHMEGMTDNMYHSANFKGEINNIGNGSVLPTTGGYINDVWKVFYKQIRRCNRLLEHISEPYFSDESERTRISAEARVWRAWYHMQLLMYYGWHDGVPIVDKVLNAADIYLPRNTVEECLVFINKEFDEVLASNALEFKWDEGRRSRMSGAKICALQMDMNLNFKKYDKAIEAAQRIIDSDKFELYYTDATDDYVGKNYRDLFHYVGKQNNERIFFTPSGLREFWFRSMSTVIGGQGAVNPLKSFVDTYEMADGRTLAELDPAEREEVEKEPLSKDRDPRMYISIMVPGDNTTVPGYVYSPFDKENSDALGKPGASRTGYMSKKFLDLQDRPSPWSGSLDFMIYRYAEVLMDYAECLIETGKWNDPRVVQYINMIRTRAGMPEVNTLVYNSEVKIRELYRRERRVEFVFEGKRYFDIRRWEIGPEVMNKSIKGAYDKDAGTFVIIEKRTYQAPKNDSWPLPEKEITSNPNIKQATGW